MQINRKSSAMHQFKIIIIFVQNLWIQLNIKNYMGKHEKSLQKPFKNLRKEKRLENSASKEKQSSTTQKKQSCSSIMGNKYFEIKKEKRNNYEGKKRYYLRRKKNKQTELSFLKQSNKMDDNFNEKIFFSETSFFKNETNRSQRAQFSRFQKNTDAEQENSHEFQFSQNYIKNRESTKSIFLDQINFQEQIKARMTILRSIITNEQNQLINTDYHQHNQGLEEENYMEILTDFQE